jgi:hypothetical protein
VRVGKVGKAPAHGHPDGGKSFSLDDMRAGKAGEKIPLESVPKVFTNEYLPSA